MYKQWENTPFYLKEKAGKIYISDSESPNAFRQIRTAIGGMLFAIIFSVILLTIVYGEWLKATSLFGYFSLIFYGGLGLLFCIGGIYLFLFSRSANNGVSQVLIQDGKELTMRLMPLGIRLKRVSLKELEFVEVLPKKKWIGHLAYQIKLHYQNKQTTLLPFYLPNEAAANQLAAYLRNPSIDLGAYIEDAAKDDTKAITLSTNFKTWLSTPIRYIIKVLEPKIETIRGVLTITANSYEEAVGRMLIFTVAMFGIGVFLLQKYLQPAESQIGQLLFAMFFLGLALFLVARLLRLALIRRIELDDKEIRVFPIGLPSYYYFHCKYEDLVLMDVFELSANNYAIQITREDGKIYKLPITYNNEQEAIALHQMIREKIDSHA